MIKINIDTNKLTLNEKKILISYLYNELEIDYGSISDFFKIQRSSSRTYRWGGDKLITEEDKNTWLKEILVEKIEEIKEIIGVLYDNDEDKVKDGVHTAYITEIYKDNLLLFLKEGKSSHLQDRMKNHSKNKNYGGNKVIVKKVYTFDNEDDALTMENYIRKYYKEISGIENYLRNDRFLNQTFEKERDIEKLNKIYKKILVLGED